MGLFGGNTTESIAGLDVGATALKIVEFDMSGEKPRLVSLGISALTTEIYTGNQISNREKLTEQIESLLESNSIASHDVALAVPAPSVFTKRIKVSKVSAKELTTNIQFEAGNFIPHNIDAVKLDYHVIGEVGTDQLEVLVVAVKNEVIETLVESVSAANLLPQIVDVDFFAVQNIFETNYPEYIAGTTALVNVGARFSSLNICRGGESLFVGDISVGGKAVTEAIAQAAGISSAEAEKIKCSGEIPTQFAGVIEPVIAKQAEHMASEFNRQLSFLWSASGAEGSIDRIVISGGGSQTVGLLESLQTKTGLPCIKLDPFRTIEIGEGFERSYLEQIGPSMTIAAGLALRELGDRQSLDFD